MSWKNILKEDDDPFGYEEEQKRMDKLIETTEGLMGQIYEQLKQINQTLSGGDMEYVLENNTLSKEWVGELASVVSKVSDLNEKLLPKGYNMERESESVRGKFPNMM